MTDRKGSRHQEEIHDGLMDLLGEWGFKKEVLSPSHKNHANVPVGKGICQPSDSHLSLLGLSFMKQQS